MLHRHGLDTGERDLGSRLGRADEAPGAVPPRAFGGRERSRHGAQTPVECELADGRMPGERARRQLMRGGQHRQRDREIEPRSLLAKVGGREVDGDPAQRPLELGGRDSAAHALLGLLACAVGEADDRERRHAALEVGFDFDAARIEADEGVGDSSREHLATVGAERAARVPTL